MKKFIKKTIIISLPIILIGIFIELFISYYPNTFNTKAGFLNSNLDSIESIFLGSSHTQNAINPKFMDMKSANLAYGSQDYQLDSALFFNYTKQLKNLKSVFVELDYHSLEKKNEPDYFRLPWYYKYYDINLGDFKAIDKLSLFFSNKSFFKNYLISQLHPFSEKLDINTFGFIENDTGIFEQYAFNKDTIFETSKNRLKNGDNELSKENFEFNKSKLLSIINYCSRNNIDLVVLINPVYKTYRSYYDKIRNARRKVFIDSLRSYENIKIMDFESDNRFDITDFKNDDHLNSNGAEKLTKLINSKLQ